MVRGEGGVEVKRSSLTAMHINNLLIVNTIRASCNHVTLDQFYEGMKCN